MTSLLLLSEHVKLKKKKLCLESSAEMNYVDS